MDNKSSPHMKICSFIVDKRNLFFLIYIILIIFSIFSSNWVSVENDLSEYLSDDTETRQTMDMMDTGTYPIMTRHLQVLALKPCLQWLL